MTDAKAAAERLIRIRSGEPWQCVYGTESAIATVEARRADICEVVYAYLAAPQWHDRPTCPGLWLHPLCDGWDTMTTANYREIDVSNPDYVFDDGPYFGPIPERPAKDAE